MKNRKTILFLLLAILVLASVEVFLDRAGRRSPSAARPFLAEDAASATTLELARRGEPETRLERTGSGSWRLVRPFASRVEGPVVLKLLDALAQAPVTESISDAELLRLGRSRADYALEDPPLRVTLADADSRRVLSFGILTPSGDGVYATAEGENAVLIVPSSALAAVDLPVDRLRRRRVFDLEAGTVSAFDVRRAPGDVLSFTREGDGWRVGADKASAAAVSRFLTAVTGVEALSFVWPTGATNESAQASASRLAGYGLDPETSVTVTLKRPGGANDSISFGKRTGEKAVYALAHSGGTVITVPASLKDAARQDVARFADARLFTAPSDAVASFSLADGGTVLAFTRLGKGDWRMDAPISAPADADAVALLLSRIWALTSADLDPAGVAVSLGGDAKPVTAARLALFPEGGGLERFRSKEVVRFAPGEVRRLVSSACGAPTSVVYAKDRKAWNVEKAPDGSVVSEAGVAKALEALAPLRAVRVERLKVAAADLAKYGLEKPSLCLSVDPDREGAVRRNVLVGAKTEGGSFATVGAADAVFVIPPAAVEALSSPLTEIPQETPRSHLAPDALEDGHAKP